MKAFFSLAYIAFAVTPVARARPVVNLRLLVGGDCPCHGHRRRGQYWGPSCSNLSKPPFADNAEGSPPPLKGTGGMCVSWLCFWTLSFLFLCSQALGDNRLPSPTGVGTSDVASDLVVVL